MMKILLCHPTQGVGHHLEEIARAAFVNVRTLCVSNLSEAYHVTEHREPHCLLIDAALAAEPDFELLNSLLRIMGVGCVLIADYSVTLPEGLANNQMVSPDCSPEEFAKVLQAACSVSPRLLARTERQPAPAPFHTDKLILIGASTGGIDALIRTLRHFGPDAPPTLIVQHTGANFVRSLIRLLDSVTSARVAGACDGEVPQQGHIYLPPDNNKHLCLSARAPRRLRLKEGPPVSGHCPSIDMLFDSAIPHASHVAAALLTGMGRDGARGLLRLRQAGAQTFGQDETSSVVYGMPRIAMEMGGVDQQLSLDKIGPALLEASRKRVRSA